VTGVILICVALLSAGATYAANWLGLIPWRRTASLHWTERARRLYPARVAAASALFVIPADAALGVKLIWPEDGLYWMLVALAAWLGAMFAAIQFDREVFPEVSLRDNLHQAGVIWLLRIAHWFLLLGAIVIMPDDFGPLTWMLIFAVVSIHVVWVHGGFLWAGRKLGLVVRPSERLKGVVDAISAKMNVPVRRVWILRTSMSNAFALPQIRTLLFTTRFLETHPDDEVAAICAHELGHLTESKWVILVRSLRTMIFLPWLLLNPLKTSWGESAFLALMLLSLVPALMLRRFGLRMERRADTIAKTNEGNPGTYARALERICRTNMMPVVTSGRPKTHPHLYDRLLAAGVVPDYPRPLPAQKQSWQSILWLMLLGILLGLNLSGFFH
jgi:Zn-dependent protease with chaperone function